jgi:hypothetical protein
MHDLIKEVLDWPDRYLGPVTTNVVESERARS